MSTQTETLTVATLEAEADGVAVTAEVRREGRRYLVMADGHRVDSTTELRAAYERMASAVRTRLPRGNPTRWSASFHCNTGGFGLSYSSHPRGGSGAPLPPCVQEAASRYRENTLHHALQHAAATLGKCCR
jgi:hypothetical protein